MTEKKEQLVVLVDDDSKIRELTGKYLSDQGLSTITADSGKSLDIVLKNNDISLIVLDVMMPDETGLNICQRLRVNGVTIPIIMLTAKGDEVDRIVGLEMGADDYLPKPFNPRELLARITAILRRQANTEVLSKNKVVIFGEYTLNIEQRSLYKKDDEISITTGEFDLLKIFAERPMQPLSRDQIMQLSRGKELDVFDRSIDVKITRLRRLIEEDPNKPVFIQTKWGFGYIFNPDGATK
ncbi:response regulator [Methylophilaceae bacterium]|jgi:two-component system phosphate regulon response regulator OmpR|nr:response regulator [Methylophilaceae bacterium]MDC1173007.1 response regulator [Methylophilaceae bacterium]|tara:strand:+ start:2547 stop:3263 length:717 start_codon:yes stop_codon:yes gene_type:complete